QTGELDDRANAAAGDHAGAVRRGLQEDLAGAEAPDDLEGNGALDERHVDHALLGLLDALADRFRHFLRLAETEPHAPRAVPDDHERAEAEAPAALHHLGHAVDVDDLLLQLGAAVVDDPPLAAGTHLRHVATLRTGGRPRGRPPPPRARGRGIGNRCGRRPPGGCPSPDTAGRRGGRPAWRRRRPRSSAAAPAAPRSAWTPRAASCATRR